MLEVHVSDFVTIALLVALEGLLSADNARVLAILVLGLPRPEQQKAVRYGILGAFAFRAAATAGAAYMIELLWVQLLGGLYLLYLPYQHFFGHGDASDHRQPKPATAWLDLSAFWLGFYLRNKASSPWHYVASETLQGIMGWVPGIVGIGLRAFAYKLFLRAGGLPPIEDHVRIHRSEDVTFGKGVYIDHGVYLHGGRGGLLIGDGSWVMSGCRLHVFNFRGIEHGGIHLGRRTFLGEETLMRGQGGITVGDDVLFAPRVQVLAVNHVMTDTGKPIMVQGITAVVMTP